MEGFDLLVVGSGPAGEKAAALAAYFGKSVAVVDKGARLGGAPVNRGGIPTKTLRETALYLTGFRRREVYGLGFQLTPDFALERLRARAAQVSETMGEEVRRNLEGLDVTVLRGAARLQPDRTVAIDTGDDVVVVTADVILIATGSSPFRPASVPFEDPTCSTPTRSSTSTPSPPAWSSSEAGQWDVNTRRSSPPWAWR